MAHFLMRFYNNEVNEVVNVHSKPTWVRGMQMRELNCAVLLSLILWSHMTIGDLPATTASSNSQESEKPVRSRTIAQHRVVRLLERNDSTGTPLLGIKLVFEDRQERYWLISDYRVHVYCGSRSEFSPVKIPEFTGVFGLSKDDKLWYVPMTLLRSAPAPDIRRFPVGFDMMQTMKCFDLSSWQESELAPETRKAIEQSGSSIMSFFPGRSEKLWCLLRELDSRNNSLMLYDGQKWTGPFAPQTSSGDRIPSRAAHANIGFQDSEGFVWLPGIKVVRFDPNNNEWKSYPKAPNILANSIYEDRKGRIWLGGSHSDVCVYDKALGAWTKYKLVDHLPRLADKNDAARLVIETIYQDQAGQMMFGTRLGLFTFGEAENKWELVTSRNSGLPTDWVTCISEDRSGRVWIGTSHGVVVLSE